MKIGLVTNLSEVQAAGRAPCYGEIRGYGSGG